MSDVAAMFAKIMNRLDAIEAKMAGGSGGSDSAGGSSNGEIPRSIVAFDQYTAECLDPFVAVSNKLGGDAAAAANNIQEAWMEMRAILVMATACKEPDTTKLQGLLGPLASKLKTAGTLVKRNEWEKHTKTCSEGIGCLNWLLVKPAPRDFIESYIGGSDYWANGIRKEFKTSNPDQIAFCNTFKTLLQELMTYVKEFHTTGVAWNPKGVSVEEYQGSSSGAPASTSASKPTAAAVSTTGATSSTNAAVSKADLFAALNKEGAVTSGLKKVTKDMQTWRSEYKGAGDAPKPVAAPKPTASKSSAPQMKGPAKLEFQSGANKWLVEYQTGPVQVTIGSIKETVYIYGCQDANIVISGKCKSIVVDGCKKVTVTFDVAMASCEVVNCQRMNIVCQQTVAAVSIDKTDGIVVTLPRSSLDTEVVASKSSEMNLSWPDEQGDMIERPIPEQYVHRISGMNVTAQVSDLYGH